MPSPESGSLRESHPSVSIARTPNPSKPKTIGDRPWGFPLALGEQDQPRLDDHFETRKAAVRADLFKAGDVAVEGAQIGAGMLGEGLQ